MTRRRREDAAAAGVVLALLLLTVLLVRVLWGLLAVALGLLGEVLIWGARGLEAGTLRLRERRAGLMAGTGSARG